jgi:hypothetical protein
LVGKRLTGIAPQMPLGAWTLIEETVVSWLSSVQFGFGQVGAFRLVAKSCPESGYDHQKGLGL